MVNSTSKEKYNGLPYDVVTSEVFTTFRMHIASLPPQGMKKTSGKCSRNVAIYVRSDHIVRQDEISYVFHMFYSHLQLQILHLIYTRVSFINQDINFNLTLKIVAHGALQSQICVI